MNPTPDLPHLEPLEIAPDTYVLHAATGGGGAPVVHLNSMVIRGAEPVVVDTGAAENREQYLEDLFSIVEPEDVRWVFASHEDIDHIGNVEAVMDRCPNATLVSTWYLCQRLGTEGLAVAPTRWRWVADGETLDVGDRTLVAVRPPLYDAPTTRGLFDPTTGVYWGSDTFAAPVPAPTRFASELDAEAWAGGFATFHAWNSPWVTLLDEARYGVEVARLEALDIRTIATCHGPTVEAGLVATALGMLRDMPRIAEVPPQPGQPVLDEILAALAAV